MKTKEGDSRATPKWLMNMFENWFDPCPLNPNPEVDGLEIEWEDKTYCNPPYSQMSKWIFKAIEENKKGKTIALLIRFDTSTKAFKSLIEQKAHILYCGERIHFKTPNGKSYASPFPSILVILENNGVNATDGEAQEGKK